MQIDQDELKGYCLSRALLRIEELEAALRWYADASDQQKAMDCGKRARKALEK